MARFFPSSRHKKNIKKRSFYCSVSLPSRHKKNIKTRGDGSRWKGFEEEEATGGMVTKIQRGGGRFCGIWREETGGWFLERILKFDNIERIFLDIGTVFVLGPNIENVRVPWPETAESGAVLFKHKFTCIGGKSSFFLVFYRVFFTQPWTTFADFAHSCCLCRNDRSYVPVTVLTNFRYLNRVRDPYLFGW